jgi:starvation-inducible DNA-binding protein
MQETTVTLLDSLLHDTLALSLKTQSFHWNVVGPHFGPLHSLFSDQYTSLTVAADTIAERIRALNSFPHPHNSNSETTAVSPIPSTPPDASNMLKILAIENEKLAYFCHTAATISAPVDAASSNLFAERQAAHSKAAWILRSHLET